jgi:hypothetical protein
MVRVPPGCGRLAMGYPKAHLTALAARVPQVRLDIALRSRAGLCCRVLAWTQLSDYRHLRWGCVDDEAIQSRQEGTRWKLPALVWLRQSVARIEIGSVSRGARPVACR